MKFAIRFTAYFVIPFFFFSCAQVVSPTGGEKDTTPPKLVSADPPNYSVNITPELIEIEFNEFLTVRNKRDNILISPPIENYEITGRRKTVRVELPDSLKSNATYSIQFGESIQDITENNPVPGFEYVFSTGESLDSLSLRGKVVDAFTKDSLPNSKVLIYKDLGDSAIHQHRPYYYAQANDKGIFEFNHLKEGEYRVFALKDLNDNLKLDPGEEVGFYPETMNIYKDTVISPLLVFKEYMEDPQIVNASMVKRGEVKLSFNQALDTIEFDEKWKNTPDPVYWELQKKGKEALVWFEPTDKDSLRILCRLNQQFIDTVKINRSKDYLTSERNRDTTFVFESSSSKIKPEKPYQIKLSNPVKSYDTGRISIWKDSTKVGLKGIKYLDFPRRSIGISGNFKMDSAYRIRFRDSAFVDLFGNRSSSANKIFGVQNKENFGFLQVKMIVDSTIKSPVVVFLKTPKGDLVRKKVVNNYRQKLNYPLLEPGNYTIKAFIDRDDDGFWDRGNVFENKLPERVIYYPGSIVVKENWELRDTEFRIPVGNYNRF